MTIEEAIKHGQEQLEIFGGEHGEFIKLAIKALKQEPKTGHWEYGYVFADGNYCKCSECKEIIKCTYPMHYCPNCGAKMAETEDT